MSAVESAEVRRWLVVLGSPLLLTSVSIIGALAWTPWLFAGAVLLAPLAMTTMAYLAISSDTNGEAPTLQQTVAKSGPVGVSELPRRDAVERRAA